MQAAGLEETSVRFVTVSCIYHALGDSRLLSSQNGQKQVIQLLLSIVEHSKRRFL